METRKSANYNIKTNLQTLCRLNHLRITELLVLLELPNNYHSVMGVVRICEHFNIKLEDFLFKKL
jgi:hypothetical protein